MAAVGFSDVTVRLTTADTTSVRAQVLRLRPGSEKAVEYAPSDPSVRGDVEQHIETKGATLPLELLIRAFEAQLAVTAPELVGRKWALFCGFEGTGGGGGRRVIPMFRVSISAPKKVEQQGSRSSETTSHSASLSSLLLSFMNVDTLEEAIVWSARLSFVVLPSGSELQRGGSDVVHVNYVAVTSGSVGEGAEKERNSEKEQAIAGQIVMRLDPNAPVRPRAAFAFYSAEMRPIFVAQHGASTYLRMMVGAWKEADEATRAKFEALAKADRDRYEREFREYSMSKIATV